VIFIWMSTVFDHLFVIEIEEIFRKSEVIGIQQATQKMEYIHITL